MIIDIVLEYLKDQVPSSNARPKIEKISAKYSYSR